jgi:hypothetical protein
VTSAEFFLAFKQELDKGAVNVAEAEEAEVVGANVGPSGAKAPINL